MNHQKATPGQLRRRQRTLWDRIHKDPGQNHRQHQAWSNEVYAIQREFHRRGDLLADKLGIPKRGSDALIHATQSIAGARGRWAELRQRGATDQEIREFLGREWTQGGYAGAGLWYDYWGGTNPRLVIGRDKQQTLKGKALIVAVRTAYAIPVPRTRRTTCPR